MAPLARTLDHCRRRGYIRKVLFAGAFLLYVSAVLTTLVFKSDHLRDVQRRATLDNDDGEREWIVEARRYRRNADGFSSVSGGLTEEAEDEEKNCTPRAVDEFPGNFLDLKPTQDGGFLIHLLIAIYMFGTLAIVCDDYFVSSLEVICERLNMQEDVAGATFMAAGSSAPEFFTSVIGVFIAKSDVGVGTIVGSAVFNILFIIGVCSIFAGMVVNLTWYPMTRDCSFYLISVATLVITIDDEKVYWYEATVLVVLYVIYIIVMYFNRPLENRAISALKRFRERFGLKDGTRDTETLDEKQRLAETSPSGTYTNESAERSTGDGSVDKETPFSADGSGEHPHVEESIFTSVFTWPETRPLQVYYVVMFPMKVLMYVSIPDCRREGFLKKLYPLTFFMSIVWIAGCSYLMVWMVTIVGDALEIPDTVSGLTILAAGTSVPDCLASIFVARDGYGDMAVSNSIGSNVFDILMCLGLPWLLDTAILKKGDPLIIQSGGIGYSALILLSTVVFLIVAMQLARWRLTKPFGCVCLLSYVVVITLACLFELNVFGDFVLPSCDRDV